MDFSTKEVRTVAGTNIQSADKEGGKPGVEQPLASPWDVCLAHSPTSNEPDLLVIANAGTHQIWGLALRNLTWWKKLQVESGTCFRLAGSGAEENRNNSYPAKAAFAQPSGLCSATLQTRSDEYLLFVADSESSSIRQVNLNDGSVKALVGGDKDPMVTLMTEHHFFYTKLIPLTIFRIYFALAIKIMIAIQKAQSCFSIL